MLGKSYFIMGVVLTKPPEHFRNSKDITLLPLPLKEIQHRERGCGKIFEACCRQVGFPDVKIFADSTNKLKFD